MIRCLVIEILHFDVFQMCWQSAFIAVFGEEYLQVQVGLKTFLQQFGSGVHILHNYQIHFDQLLCFQEIPVTESHGQNSALNSTVKPLRIA